MERLPGDRFSNAVSGREERDLRRRLSYCSNLQSPPRRDLCLNPWFSLSFRRKRGFYPARRQKEIFRDLHNL